MSTTGPKTFILPHDPLTPLDSTTAPSPLAVRKLRFELCANAKSVSSTLGGGNHGHLGMILPQAEYIKISTGATAYTFPDQVPEPPAYDPSPAVYETLKNAYTRGLHRYNEAQALRSQLMGQLLRAVPETYREVLEDTDYGGYTNINPATLLQHLFTVYGTIKLVDLDENVRLLHTPWDPDTPIENVFINGKRCRGFAAEGGDPITDVAYIRALLNVFRNSGVMESALMRWQEQPQFNHTVKYAIQHFTNANAYRQQAKLFLKETLQANQVHQTPASTDALAHSATAPERRPTTKTNLKGLVNWGYCWSHGITKHDGENCLHPKPGHIKEATLADPQGGNTTVLSQQARKKRRTTNPETTTGPTR